MRVRITARFTNEHFRSARIEAGFARVIELKEATGISLNDLYKFENFRGYPRTRRMERRLERALGVLTEDLFPQVYKDAVDRKLGLPLVRVLTVKELPEWAGPKMLPEPQDVVEAHEMREAVHQALDTLTEREAKVLKMRYAIGGGFELNLEEIGLQLGVSRERIRQIEAKALRKLKHPWRSRELRDFIGPGRKREKTTRMRRIWDGYAVCMWDRATPLCTRLDCQKLLEPLKNMHIEHLNKKHRHLTMPPEVIKWPKDFLYCENCNRIYRRRRKNHDRLTV